MMYTRVRRILRAQNWSDIGSDDLYSWTQGWNWTVGILHNGNT